MKQFNGCTIYEAHNGDWVVGTLMSTGQVAVVKGCTRFASEASATLEAKRNHFERPHMNFTVVRA